MKKLQIRWLQIQLFLLRITAQVIFRYIYSYCVRRWRKSLNFKYPFPPLNPQL